MNEEISSKFHQKLHKWIKWPLVSVLLVFILTLTVSEVLEIRDKLKTKERITFSGQGKAIGIPDIASVNFSIITEKLTAKEAMTKNAETMNEIVKFIKTSGVDQKDIKTSQYYLSPRYDWVEGKRIFKGYQLISTLAVKIRDLEKISEIIDGAILKGANQVGDIQFIIDDPEKLKEEARNKAIENVKEKAESIAKATGLKLGKIVSFSESATPDIYPLPYSLETTKEAEVGGTPEVEKGSQEITVNVSLIFELR